MAVELYDDIEQAERVKKWVRENGSGIVIGLLLAFAGIFGFRYWQQYQFDQNLNAARQYTILQSQLTTLADATGETAESARIAVEQALKSLQQDYGKNLYADLASLQVADQHIKAGELEAADAQYDFIINNNDQPQLANLAKLRKARVLIDLEQYDTAIQLLDSIKPATQYAALINRAKGEAYYAKGDRDQALAAFEAVAAELGGTPDRLVTLRLQELQQPDIQALLSQTQGTRGSLPSSLPPELLQQPAAPTPPVAVDNAAGGDETS